MLRYRRFASRQHSWGGKFNHKMRHISRKYNCSTSKNTFCTGKWKCTFLFECLKIPPEYDRKVDLPQFTLLISFHADDGQATDQEIQQCTSRCYSTTYTNPI